MPRVAYDGLLIKQAQMINFVKRATRKKVVRIPLTKVMIALSENPIDLRNDYVLKLAFKKRGKP